MRKFKSVGQAQRFLSAAFRRIADFKSQRAARQSQPKRHKLSAKVTREIIKQKIED